jgi:diaminopimelate decarboxylase
VSEEGLGVDVCTGGELEVALSAGVPPEQITMHGNNKTLDELSRAVTAGVGHIVADSFEEIARLAYLTEAATVRPKILVRVTTGVEAHTHEFMATAHDDQKFGFSLASGAADEAVRRVLACPGLSFAGLHSHIGSQIFDTAGFEVAAHRVVGLAVRSTASRSPSSTWAAGSASPTPTRTTPPTSRTWPRACARSWTGSAGPPGWPGRG